ncbi:TPA: hypothetical protein R8G44_005422, partial [Citrobacter braakii]|nr:hypothetical protein [Citrobacter braakii]
MTTYNTGNSLGSAAAKDLNDNAQNMDYLMNDQVNDRRNDRLGHSRKTWHGMESAHEKQLARFSAAFQEFLVKSGYDFLGDYEDGPLTFTARNQTIRYQGQFWRLNTATDVPFTTRGTDAISWAEDVNHLVLMDADMLRQELALPDGAWLVGLGDLTLGEIL